MSDRDRDRDRKRRDYYDDDRYDKRSKKDDHHSSKRNEPSKDERPHEFIDINWKDYQSYVDGIFFKKSDLIRKGSADYDEFWDFLEKYISFKRAKRAKNIEPAPDVVDKELANKLGIPTTYNERYLLNFTVIADPPKYANRGITTEDLNEFLRVIHLYQNFCQKRNFQKILKIKEEKLALPIAKYKEDLLNKVRDNNVILVAGDTGCGKSTQVVQYLVEAGYTKIACTQPRRIATMSLAKRVAYETFNEYGSEIGYQIRFESNRSASTKILFLTEGLLLRQLSGDPLLKQYNVLLLDEVHERHIHTDFLLAILRELIKKRTDLKLILMSATINIELFSNYFYKPPIIMVPGRLYPIQVEYHPIEEDREAELEKDKSKEEKEEDKKKRVIMARKRLDPKPFLRIIERIDQQFPPTERGDLLVFLSGIEEIMCLAEELKEYAKQTKRWAVLMLHSSLSLEQQDKVFDISPDGIRKCILSTNIAETSVTIQGIRFVIDSGKVKEIGYDAESKLQRLQEFWISKASAEQRKGRAGRTGPGFCFRLYSPQDYEQFIDYSTPEIQRIPLESIILQIKTLHFGDPRQFPFIESPAMDTIEASVKSLKLHDALAAVDEEITPLGQVLASLPVDIPVGKILVLAALFDLVEPVLTVAAVISVQSPFVRITSDEILNARNSFISDHGDPFTLYNVFCDWIKIKYKSSENSKKWCRRHGIEEQRLYEASKLRSQFKQLLRDAHLLPEREDTIEHTQDIFDHKHKKYEVQAKRRELKKLQQERDKTRSRKILQIDDMEVRDAVEEEEHLEQLDLRDVDFRLSHNIQELLDECENALSKQEINVIKYILTSGFYPNIAYPDEFNQSHKESEQVYHSLYKTFTSLHPTSIFYGRSVLIQASDLLGYEKLLETNKPYLTNVFRIPALQMLLLAGQSIDTNRDCSSLLVDDWIGLKFTTLANAEKVLLQINELRLLIRNLLRKKLKAMDLKDFQTNAIDFESIQAPSFIMQMINDNILSGAVCTSEELKEKFAKFIETPLGYTIEKIKQSEILDHFRKIGEDNIILDKENPMALLEASRLVKDIQKGGVQVCSYLRYNSLLSEAEMPRTLGMSKHLKKKYKCPECNKEFMFNLDEVDAHLQSHK